MAPAWKTLGAAMLLSVSVHAGCAHGGKDGPPRHYDDPEAMIATFEKAERDTWQLPERVVRRLPISSKAAVIAEIGAGSGYFTRRLAAEVPEGKVYAVDVDSAFEKYVLEHREAWGTPNIEPHLALYEDPLLPAGEIDLVFSANTYAYIRDRPAYFAKVRATLRAGGRLAIIDFRKDAALGGSAAPAPEHRVSRDTALAELNQAGFELDSEETFLPHQWFLILRPNESS